MSLIKKLTLDTEHIAFEYIGAEDETKEICFDTKEHEIEFYKGFTQYIIDEIMACNARLLNTIHQAFEDFLEENITEYNGYVRIECEEDMVDCWSHKPWCKVFVEHKF